MDLGAHLTDTGAAFAVHASLAERVWLCLFGGDRETRLEMARGPDGVFHTQVSGLAPGALYGYRADGPYDPARNLWFDPDKLLVDPHATRLDRRFTYDPRLAARRGEGGDTAALVPRAILEPPPPPVPHAPPRFTTGGLIYELNVHGFTMRRPDVLEADRGTLRALAHPAVIAHLQRLHVSAVELMPVADWIDERHLPPLGLSNAWGYNPIAFKAIDPRLAPGGIADLRFAVDALHAAGIGVILDVVFNHTGESDALGPTLSLRGLDPEAYATTPDGALINDAGTGNTLACWKPPVRALVLDSLRWWVEAAGVDGFRFDLAPVLARTPEGFDPSSPIFAEIAADPPLSDRVMIAEPWDPGPGGYQLGAFPVRWLEWNDRYRDDVRRFWRGDGGMGALATRIVGSSDVFAHGGARTTRTVNFIAAHDGFTLEDTVAYATRHNHANGEDNRDGHAHEVSWNGGAEGVAAPGCARALLATLFASRGTIMLTAGDEFGRSQGGNNNAYAQDNETTWLDWEGRDRDLEAFVADLAAFRAAHPALSDPTFLSDGPAVAWLDLDGRPLDPTGWERPDAPGFELRLETPEGPVRLRVDRAARTCTLNACGS